MSSFATVFEAFEATCRRWGDHSFLALTSVEGRRDDEVSFERARSVATTWAEMLRRAGYGPGHRIAVSLGNDPSHFIVHLALNAIGASAVPVNPDMTAEELAYVLAHSEAVLVIVDDPRSNQVAKACRLLDQAPTVMNVRGTCPKAPTACAATRPGIDAEASLLYTSGTTGRPKGCVLTNAYYLRIGKAYAQAGGVAEVRPGAERILNPLPVFHQNAGIFSFMCALLSGNCILMTDRFHASTWWQEVIGSEATVIHYLGVMPAILLKMPPAAADRAHQVRFGIGAGVEPSLHAPFEDRFGFPLVELWGMTEVGCGFIASAPSREIGTRAVGGPRPGNEDDLQVRLVDTDGREVARGAVGELLVRRQGLDRAQGMFSGYLKDAAATQEAWQDGWFHTGDAFWQDEAGVLHFAERKKNIIRRSGENIAAAEVEAVLLEHAGVGKVAVMAVPDDIREEEVMACIVRSADAAGDDRQLADALFALCMTRIAYYKAPGWFVFLDAIPVTTTQKVQKAKIFAPDEDPRRHPRAIDLRLRKRRSKADNEESTT